MMEEYINIFLASVIGAGLGSSIITIIVNRKLQHHYDQVLEKRKIQGDLVGKRYDSAVLALNSLSRLNQNLVADLKKFEIADGESPPSKILQDFHPQYRAKYRVIRSQLETVNELLSFYSLSYDELLHPIPLRELLSHVKNQRNTSDCKQAYRAIWQMVFDSLNAVLRVAQSYEFWTAESNYREKAEAWAKSDKEKLETHFIEQFRDTPNKTLDLYPEYRKLKQFRRIFARSEPEIRPSEHRHRRAKYRRRLATWEYCYREFTRAARPLSYYALEPVFTLAASRGLAAWRRSCPTPPTPLHIGTRPRRSQATNCRTSPVCSTGSGDGTGGRHAGLDVPDGGCAPHLQADADRDSSLEQRHEARSPMGGTVTRMAHRPMPAADGHRTHRGDVRGPRQWPVRRQCRNKAPVRIRPAEPDAGSAWGEQHQKSGRDADEWIPRMNRCWFAGRVVPVKRKYGLTVDVREGRGGPHKLDRDRAGR